MSNVQEDSARGEEKGRLGGYEIAITGRRGADIVYECAKLDSA